MDSFLHEKTPNLGYFHQQWQCKYKRSERLQLNLQLKMHAPYICGLAWSDMVQGCMEYTERAEMAAVSRVHHFSGYSKMSHKKLYTQVESHVSAVSVLESGEQRYIKVINNSNNKTSHLQYTVQRVCHTYSILCREYVTLTVSCAQSMSHLQYTAQRVCQLRWDIPPLGLRPPLTKGSPHNSGAERCWSNRHSGAFSPPPPGMWTTVGYHSEVSVRLPGQ